MQPASDALVHAQPNAKTPHLVHVPIAGQHEEVDQVDVNGVEPAAAGLQAPHLPSVVAHIAGGHTSCVPRLAVDDPVCTDKHEQGRLRPCERCTQAARGNHESKS